MSRVSVPSGTGPLFASVSTLALVLGEGDETVEISGLSAGARGVGVVAHRYAVEVGIGDFGAIGPGRPKLMGSLIVV